MDILVVDDFEANRYLLRSLLEDHGHTVLEAEDGRQAIDVFCLHRPDLVLMDVMMPIMNGYDSAIAIKAKLTGEHVPIIFLTAVTAENALATALQGGGDDFLTKPFNEAILIAKIKAHARIKDLNEEISKKNSELNAFKNIIDSETELAEHIFATALRQNYLHAPHLAFYVSPASTFNGDMLLGAVGPAGNMYMMMADFTGHGLPAAIGAIPVSAHFFELARQGVAVGEMAEILNRQLCGLLPSMMFCAAVIIEQSAKGQEFTVWTGGLPNGYILDAKGHIKDELQSRHMPLAVLEDHEFDRQVDVFRLRKGEALIFYTDGLTEAVGPTGEMFGEERLKAIINCQGGREIAEIIDSLRAFLAGEKADDDITLLRVMAQPLEVDDPLQVEQTKMAATVGWSLELPLDTQTLKQDLPIADQLLAMLGNQPVFRRHKDYLHTIFAEFYSNALEHGILGLSSDLKDTDNGYMEYYQLRTNRLAALKQGSIHIRLQLLSGEVDRLAICFQDSGAGFDYKNIETRSEDDSYGRGILLVRSMTELLRYSEQGTRVDAVYPLRSCDVQN